MRMNFKTLGGAALMISLAFSAAAQEKVTRHTVIATVDGNSLTLGHVIALRSRLPEQYQNLADEILFPAIVDQLIQQTVLMNAANNTMGNQLAVLAENEQRAFLASEMVARLSERSVTEEELQTAYAERYDAEIPEPEFDASHILVDTEEEALELVKILQDGADFAELAKEKSTGPSGVRGGALGWFGKGAMVPEFETAVTSMAVGEVSGPIQTQFGWHVIRLNEMRNKPVPTLDEVRPQLTQELQQSGIENEVLRLTKAAEVTRTELDIDPSIIRDVSLFEE